jgi:hypothetical protein
MFPAELMTLSKIPFPILIIRIFPLMVPMDLLYLTHVGKIDANKYSAGIIILV